MSAEDNDNTAAELPHTSEEDNSSSDIEQGSIVSENTDGLRLSSSWATAATSGGTSILTPSTATKWPLVDLEHVDDEDVAPVPLIQQITDMGIEKKDTKEAPPAATSADGHESIGGGSSCSAN
jgi:hypothetical protein